MTAGGRDKKAVLEKGAGAASALNGEFTDAGPRSLRPEPETDLGRDVAASLPATSLHVDGRGSSAGSRNAQGDSEAPPPSRSEAVTLVRSSRGFAYADTLAMLDEPTTPAPTEWCVDLGERLITLSTFETWTAIARGEVRAATRAWREGLECWTRVDELPELACALGDLEATAETPATPAPVITDLPTPDSLAAFERETVAEGDEIPPPAMRGRVFPLFAAARRAASPRRIGALFVAAAADAHRGDPPGARRRRAQRPPWGASRRTAPASR